MYRCNNTVYWLFTPCEWSELLILLTLICCIKPDRQTSSALNWFHWGHEVIQPASQSLLTLSTGLWGGWPLPPGLHSFLPHCLLFPDRDGADCVSLIASAAPIPQGAPLTMTRLSAGTDSPWQLTQGKQRRETEEWRAPWGEINGRTLAQERQMPGLN